MTLDNNNINNDNVNDNDDDDNNSDNNCYGFATAADPSQTSEVGRPSLRLGATGAGSDECLEDCGCWVFNRGGAKQSRTMFLG